MNDLVKQLRDFYENVCEPTHDSASLEPEYMCPYCEHKDVVPSHDAGCPVVASIMAADEIEQLQRIKHAADEAHRLLAGGRDLMGVKLENDTYQTRADAALEALHHVFGTTKDSDDQQPVIKKGGPEIENEVVKRYGTEKD